MDKLLTDGDPAPFTIERASGRSPMLLICDHASNRIPNALGDLGLQAGELQRHIAWDIGVAGVSQHLSELLDAPLVLQNYSRLVIDCNRPPGHEQSIPSRSEATEIPANIALDRGASETRAREIFAPYHAAITSLLERTNEPPSALVSMHSFTPNYLGDERPWHIGILYDADRRMAASMLADFATEPDCCVGDNEPYRIDSKDYGTPVHGEARGIAHVLIELRQDLIAEHEGQRLWAERLAHPLKRAFAAAMATGNDALV